MISVLTEKRPAVKLRNIARNFGSCRKNASHLNGGISPGISVLTEKRLALSLEYTARNFGPDRKRLAFQLRNIAREFGSDRQTSRRTPEFRFWLKNASHSNWSISPEIVVPTGKYLAFRLGDTAGDFGSGRTTPRIQTGKNCQGFWFCPTHTSHSNR